MSSVRDFLDRHFLHFNARETVAAARAYEEHVAAGGKMLVTLAGAMSTGELGIILARMIRAGKVHALSVTGANLGSCSYPFGLYRPSLTGLRHNLQEGDSGRLCPLKRFALRRSYGRLPALNGTR